MSTKPFIVRIVVEFEYPCEAGDEVEAEMLGRHVAAGELGHTPLLGAGTWTFHAFSADEGGEDPWAV
jgi:hypothetical protein